MLGLLALPAGCADDAGPVIAGLPDDLASAVHDGEASGVPGRPVVARFDGYYVGALSSEAQQPRCSVGSGAMGPAMLPLAVRRDMLVVDGRATFGVNLPFTGLAAPGGDVEMRYLDLGTLTGRFTDSSFTGTLVAGRNPPCVWAIRLDKVAVPLPEGVQVQPVDVQATPRETDAVPLPPGARRSGLSGPRAGSPAP